MGIGAVPGLAQINTRRRCLLAQTSPILASQEGCFWGKAGVPQLLQVRCKWLQHVILHSVRVSLTICSCTNICTLQQTENAEESCSVQTLGLLI